MFEVRDRDREWRFKLLEGVKWDIDRARILLCWVDWGMMPEEFAAFAKRKQETEERSRAKVAT